MPRSAIQITTTVSDDSNSSAPGHHCRLRPGGGSKLAALNQWWTTQTAANPGPTTGGQQSRGVQSDGSRAGAFTLSGNPPKVSLWTWKHAKGCWFGLSVVALFQCLSDRCNSKSTVFRFVGQSDNVLTVLLEILCVLVVSVLVNLSLFQHFVPLWETVLHVRMAFFAHLTVSAAFRDVSFENSGLPASLTSVRTLRVSSVSIRLSSSRTRRFSSSVRQ